MTRPLTLWLMTVALALASALSGCASMGTQLDTFNKKVAAANATVVAIAEACNAAIEARKLPMVEAQKLGAMLQYASEAIDTAEHLYPTNPKGAEDKLATAILLLQTIQAAIAAHAGAPT